MENQTQVVEATLLGETIPLESTSDGMLDRDTVTSSQKESLQTNKSEVELLQEKPEKLNESSALQVSGPVGKEKSLSLSRIRSLLDENSLTDQELIENLKTIINESTKPNPKTGELEIDYDTKLKAIMFAMKLKGFTAKEPEVVVNLFSSQQTNYG